MRISDWSSDVCSSDLGLSLPETQIWLAHNAPQGQRPGAYARYPMPKWTPDGGWRVDKALVFAHALQESNFRASVVSPAGDPVLGSAGARVGQEGGSTFRSGGWPLP